MREVAQGGTLNSPSLPVARIGTNRTRERDIYLYGSLYVTNPQTPFCTYGSFGFGE
jgi:hypothetical protein